MRVVFDKDGYVDQWIMDDNSGSIPDENERIINTPDDLDVLDFVQKFKHYHLVDSKLVKDENRQSQLDGIKKKEKKVLSMQEKLKLFIEAFEVDEQPDYKEGVEYQPYFDKKNMKFAWKMRE